MEDTKERILTEALRLFAADGYEAVSVRAIAERLGITKGALYRHYADKRDIFNAILHRMSDNDAARARAFALPEETVAKTPEAYRRVQLDALLAYTEAQFDYWTEDALATPFRRMLTIEQYRSADMAALYQSYLANGPLGYLMDLFAKMRPGLSDAEARGLAVAFYAPVYLLMSVCDDAMEKSAARQAVRAHLAHFKKEWSGKEGYHDLSVK